MAELPTSKTKLHQENIFVCCGMFDKQSCVLCLEKPSGTANHINIDSNDEQSIKTREIIQQHFKEGLSVMPYLITKVVCKPCLELLQSFHQFYVRVQNLHLEAINHLKSLQELEIAVIDIKVESDGIDVLSPPRARLRGIVNSEENSESKPESNITNETLRFPFIDSNKNNAEDKNTEFLAIRSEDERSESSSVMESNPEKSAVYSSTGKNKVKSKISLKSFRTRQKNNSGKHHRKRGKTADYDEFIAHNFKLICNLCQNSLTDFRELKSHFREEHQTNGYAKCCGKKLYKRGLLVDHIHVHIDPQYFKCHHCGKALSDRSGLESHLQIFHGPKERIHKCDICSKSFFNRKVLSRHLLIHAPDEQKNIKCLQCDKTFCNQYTMKQHLALVHLNLYAKICDICGKALNGNDAFRRHQEEHAGVPIPTVKCALCNTELKTKYGLARHMKRMHTKEYQTPQMCPICSKVSPSLRAHKSHMVYMHTTEKKHACSLCDKAFKLPRCLREHMSTHLGEVLYTCTFCPQTFKSQSHMYAHRKWKHPKEWDEKCKKRHNASGMGKKVQTICS